MNDNKKTQNLLIITRHPRKIQPQSKSQKKRKLILIEILIVREHE